MRAQTGTTQLGTPHARAWDAHWIQVVDAEETRLQRRICGACGYGHKACLMQPASENGRCRFHGGFAGAPNGNRNALRHGLYARRLQVCGPTCAAYGSCPVAVTEAERRLLPEPPLCPFETEELRDALRDAGVTVDEDAYEVGTHSWQGSLARGTTDPDQANKDEPNSWHGSPTRGTSDSDQASPTGANSWHGRPGHDDPRAGRPCHEDGLGYEVALLRVMLGRAAVAIAHHGLSDETVATGRDYEMRYRKSSAFLDAFVRLSREYRLLHRIQSVEREEAAKAAGEAWFANALRAPDEDDEGEIEDNEEPERTEGSFSSTDCADDTD